MKVEVKFGAKLLSVEVCDDATLGDLRREVHAASGVAPSMQKLMGRPNLKDDAALLSALGIRDGTKLMLVGSAAKDVVEANSDSKEKEAERQKALRNLPAAFWLLPPVAGLLADPYVDGTVDGGAAALALVVLDLALSRVNALGTGPALLGRDATAAVAHPLLADVLRDAAAQLALARSHQTLRRCLELATEASQADGPRAAPALAARFAGAVDAVAVGEWLMLPAGWSGMTSANVLYLLVTRTAPAVFSVVVVNRADGVEYHRQHPTAEKLLAQCCTRIDGVARERVVDEGFWLLLLAQWVRGTNDPSDRSEFVRGEVFYDVLLPWLAERADATPGAAVGPLALRSVPALLAASTVPVEELSTPARSSSGAVKGALSALAFLLREAGLPHATVKLIKYAVKHECFVRSVEELAVAAARVARPQPPPLVAAAARLARLGVTARGSAAPLQHRANIPA